MKQLKFLIKTTFREWRKQRPDILGAVIAFYIIFSLGPLLVASLGIMGLIFGKSVVEGQLLDYIRSGIGVKPAMIMQVMIDRAFTIPSRIITTIISFPLIFFGSTMIFFQVKNALNTIWGVNRYNRYNSRGVVKNYFFSFFMVFVLWFILILLIVKSLILVLLREYIVMYLPFPVFLLQVGDIFFTFTVTAVLFAAAYKILLEVPIGWTNIWVGGFVTSFLFMLSQALIGLYLRKTDIDSAFGALGSLTVLIIWIFYSSQIFLMGAVFTKVFSETKEIKKKK